MRIKLLVSSMCIFLFGCSFSSDSYFVRFWNGDIPVTLSKKEEYIYHSCYEETDYMPQETYEDREKSSLEIIKCIQKKKKIMGIE